MPTEPIRSESGRSDERLHLLEELVESERLQEKRIGPNWMEGGLAAGGHDDNRNVPGSPVAELPFAKLPSGHFGHHQVQQNEAGRRAIPRQPQRPLRVGGGHRLIPGVGQRISQTLAQLDVVIDDEEPGALVHDALGSCTLKVDPWPGSLSTEIVPWQASTICLQTQSANQRQG